MGLTLDALLAGLSGMVAPRDYTATAAEIASLHQAWLGEWMGKLTHDAASLNPYRVLWDLQHTVDMRNTIITHGAGSPRDPLSPFWRATEPLSYLG